MSHIDRKCLIKDVSETPLKPIQYAKDCGVTRARHNKIKKVLNTTIEMRHSSNKIEPTETFEQNREGHLMKECDMQLKLIRMLIKKKTE